MGLRYPTQTSGPPVRCVDGTLSEFDFAAGSMEEIIINGRRATVWYDWRTGEYVVSEGSRWEWLTPRKDVAYQTARGLARTARPV